MSSRLAADQLAMTRRRGFGGSLALPLADMLVMSACFSLGGLVNLSYENLGQERVAVLLLLAAGCVALFSYQGHYSRRRPFWQELGDVVLVVAVALIVDAALLYLLKLNFSRVWVLTSWGAVIVAVPLTRGLVKQVRLRLGIWRQPTVVIGAGPTALEAAEAFARDNHLGYEIVAFLDPTIEAGQGRWITVGGGSVPVEPTVPEPGAVPARLGRPHVIVALELDKIPGRQALLEQLSLYHGDIDVISPLRGLPINNTRVTHFFSHDVLSLRIYNSLARPLPQLLKRLFDLVAGLLLLVVAAPLMSVIAWQVRRSGGPILFAHERIGRHGQTFHCYKFRTMVPDAAARLARLLAVDPTAQAEWQRDFKLRSDPRVTPIGHWLRKTSLDELPQLLNVLKGEMSLVGPRPVVKEELARYGDARIYYTQVRPGLTGLWQISGRNDLDYQRRIGLDTWYVRNWTLWYDVVILAKTLAAVLQRSGAY